MFENLKGKKLLIIGGVKMMREFVKRAQALGVYVVVTDYLKDSPAKEIADKSFMVNALDVEGIVQLCKNEKIDGVTTGYVDILLPVCREVCKRLNIPYYATEELIKGATDKGVFKQYAKKHGIPIPRTYDITKDNYKEKASEIEYPVFVKPLDASGSRGAAVCYDKEKFLSQFELALSYSTQKIVIVEEYLTGVDIILDFLIVNGQPYLMSLFDRMMCKDRPSAINHANLLIAPSRCIDKFTNEVIPCVKSMLQDMGVKNGIMFLQGYVDGTKITFFEMGCRLGGTFPNIVEYFTGVNPIDALVSHALTGKMVDEEKLGKVNGKYNGLGGVINLLVKANGLRIGSIKGVEEIRKIPQVVQVHQLMEVGDSFNASKNTDSPVVIVHFAAKNLSEYKEIVQQVYDLIEVTDESGKSLLMDQFGLDQIENKFYK